MRLVVHELVTELEQEIKVGDRALDIVAIAPHLYLHNSPPGTFILEVRDEAGEVVGQSTPVLFSALPIDAPYFHGYVRFDLTAAMRPGEAYRVRLWPAGAYTFSEASYVGWCTDEGQRKVEAAYSPSEGKLAPLDFELWEARDAERSMT